MTTYYLSGPMRGIPEHNFPQFHDVEAALWGWLNTQGGILDTHDVLNPARDFGGDPTRPVTDYMQVDLEQVLRSDVIVLLPGWRESAGAGREVLVALWTGKRFMGTIKSTGTNGKLYWRFEDIDPPAELARANPGPGARLESAFITRALAEMAADVAQVNRARGWYSEDRTFGDLIALLHSEASEALEAFREHGLDDVTAMHLGSLPDEIGLPKPEGVGSEFADVLIRLLDMCQRYGINLGAEYSRKLAYNRTRPFRHGGKRL